MKKLVFLFLIFCCAVNIGLSTKSDGANVDTNAKIKAVFIYNFTKYIEWPSDYQSGEFTIGILGENSALFNELDKMSKVKKVSNQSFSIRSFNSVSDISKPHILYIPKDSKMKVEDAIGKLKGTSTLIVTERPGLAKQGSTINFVVEGNRQKFELNKSNAQKHNLKVASILENLAILVN